MRISEARLKKLAKNYRKTKRYPILAEVTEYRYLQDNWDKVQRIMLINNYNLEAAVGLTVGLWQSENGFLLTSRQVFRKFNEIKNYGMTGKHSTENPLVSLFQQIKELKEKILVMEKEMKDREVYTHSLESKLAEYYKGSKK